MIGEVFYADLSPAVGNELGGVRPVVVIREDGATATVALLRYSTSEPSVRRTIVIDPPFVDKYLEFSGQIRTVDWSRLYARVGIMSRRDVRDLMKSFDV